MIQISKVDAGVAAPSPHIALALVSGVEFFQKFIRPSLVYAKRFVLKPDAALSDPLLKRIEFGEDAVNTAQPQSPAQHSLAENAAERAAPSAHSRPEHSGKELPRREWQ